ncbi:MAG TPA: tripartite tricarboxylate transporter substrate binding protein [Rubrivivax sp.]|nr:tripartite tricarboxylate transporter substrate binding protein [Rubrivivax sp.]
MQCARFGAWVGALLWALLAALSDSATAQAGPARPVRIVVPFPPGQGSDLLARALAHRLARARGQPVVVENRPGANGILALEAVARAPADGYTLLCTSSSPLVVNPALHRRLRYDSESSFAPVGLLAEVPMALVSNRALPVHDVAGLIRHARAHPGRLRFASPGNGTTSHLAFERFKAAAGLKIDHVPYKGSPRALNDLIAGRVELMFDALPTSLPHVRSGRLSLLATATRQRSALTPEVPTFAEGGATDFVLTAWYALLAPAGTPPPVLSRLNEELRAFVGGADTRRQFEAQGFELQASTPGELALRIRSEKAEWAAVVKQLGVRIE